MVQLDAIAQIEKQAKQLKWALKEFLPHINDFNSQFTISQNLKSRSQSLQDAIERACPSGESDCLELEITTLTNTVELLKVMGYLDAMPLAQLHGQTAPLRPFPAHVLSDFSAAIETISKHCEARREETQFREQAQKAIAGGVFKEWVERNPGAGAQRRLGPFKTNMQFDAFGDEGPVSWEETMLFEYPIKPNSSHAKQDLTQWVVFKAGYHREADFLTRRDVEVVDKGIAARIVLDSEESVDVEILQWAKANAAPPTPVARRRDTPHWDAVTRTLTFRGKTARTFGPRATTAFRVLECFELDGWPVRIDTPMADDTKTRDAIRTLNRDLTGLKFQADGQGTGIEWVAGPDVDFPF